MKELSYRRIKREDYPAVGEILNQAFGLFRYVQDERSIQYLKRQYVYSCLAEATQTCVAVDGNTMAGVIMGNAQADYHLLPHLPFLLAAGWYGLLLFCRGKKCRSGLNGYRRLHKIYHTFSKCHEGEFDSVLTLFAVDERYRGHSIGKTLLNRLLRSLQNRGAKRIYLYTDTTCNVKFYEYQGFERLEEEPMVMIRDGKPAQMDVYLYGRDISSALYS
ncbi:MAG: GNAT family N-acetyltransferase [Oscillospiraceae bacterium]